MLLVKIGTNCLKLKFSKNSFIYLPFIKKDPNIYKTMINGMAINFNKMIASKLRAKNIYRA